MQCVDDTNSSLDDKYDNLDQLKFVMKDVVAVAFAVVMKLVVVVAFAFVE